GVNMKKIDRNNNENGLTLIEVLASIVILTLILTAFLMTFLQGAKTNLTSEKILDAIYYAQVEMENIYALSVDGNDKESGMSTLNYNQAPSSENNSMIFTKEENRKFFEVKLTEDEDALT